jgi:hypothetical protein
VAVEIPFARSLGPRHRQRKWLGKPDVVSHAARQQAACPVAERRRPGILPAPSGRLRSR